jgi:MFS family permease
MTTSLASEANVALTPHRRFPIYFHYGWVNLVVAAVAMSVTLPGRTYGLGLIAKPLTEDPGLGIGEWGLSALNFWAILLGSALCLPVGRMIDRFGVRLVLPGVAAALGASVWWMSWLHGVFALFVALTLIRGLGQGALSVVSMAMVGKWFRRRLGLAMGIYSVLLAVGFIAPIFAVQAAITARGWRDAWAGVGFTLLLVFAPLGWLLTRDTPESLGLELDGPLPEDKTPAGPDLTLSAALRSMVFWAFTLAASLFILVFSAVTLFNQSLLEAKGFDEGTSTSVMAMLVFAGLPANLLCGWLARQWPLGRLLAVGMFTFAIALVAFPLLQTRQHVLVYAAAMGAAGGMITVVFLTFYGQAFGRAHLGAIQAAAQVVSVFASALGPVLLTSCKDRLGTATPMFHVAAVLAIVLALAAWAVPFPGEPEKA